MLKTFVAGFVLGVVAVVAGAYLWPAVDQHRETSIIAVLPNGGNSETFHINIPTDRIVVGATAADDTLPPGLEWPSDAILAGVRAEVFKLRNARDTVIGVASRLETREAGGDSVQWVLHLPARGALYARLPAAAHPDGTRGGEFVAGTREFASLAGRLTERAVDGKASDEGPAGRIELAANFVATASPVAEGEEP